MAMEPYDTCFAVAPFALNNPGSICHFNSLLQALASCPSLIKAVLNNQDYLEKTATGKAFANFVKAMASEKGAKNKADEGINFLSYTVLGALMKDLRNRRPSVKFGSNQESASEGLVLLLDMMEPPREDDEKYEESPISQLFQRRTVILRKCTECKKITSKEVDYNVQINMFSDEIDQISTKQQFTKFFLEKTDFVSDCLCANCNQGFYCAKCDIVVGNLNCKKCDKIFPCPNCRKYTACVACTKNKMCADCSKDPRCKNCNAKPVRTKELRKYTVTMVPEILVFLFNIYKHPRTEHFTPGELNIPGKNSNSMRYIPVAQIEHTGALDGGHYKARGLRKKGFYIFDDDAPPVPCLYQNKHENVYIAIFHLA